MKCSRYYVAVVFLVFSIPALAQTGLVPLNDLGAGTYKGFTGGLYPGGSNQIPGPHRAAGVAAASRIRPLDSAGRYDAASGRIVLLSLGMSNATQEFSAFKQIAGADPRVNRQLVIVDGAQGGQTAAIVADSTEDFWNVVDRRLAAAGVTRRQVQVVWLKEANARPKGAFPGHADTLRDQLAAIVRIAKDRFPNLRVAFNSSRTYGGYATTDLNPEPYAYEGGFAVKWMIERQISGDPALAFDGSTPVAPWLAWGPYLWADGPTPRSDGLQWQRSDFGDDGTHPNTAGRAKVARILLEFFENDLLTRSWFTGSISGIEPEVVGTRVFNFSANAPGSAATITISLDSPCPVSLALYRIDGTRRLELFDGTLGAGEHRLHATLDDLETGLYFCRLVSPGKSSTLPVMILR